MNSTCLHSGTEIIRFKIQTRHHFQKPKLSGPNSSNMWTRSRQTLVNIHGGLSPPFAQVLFKWRIWQRNSVLATRLKCVQTVELCLRSHVFLRYKKKLQNRWEHNWKITQQRYAAILSGQTVLTASWRNQRSLKWSGMARYVGQSWTHPSARIDGMTRERSLKNLNQIVLVVSSNSPGPGYRRGRFSRFAELSIALTLFSNIVE